MSDIRENLKPLLNKRVRVRGIFAKWDDHWVSHRKQVGRVCIRQPEIDGEVVAQYVWVVGVPHWKQYRDALGSQVIFEALVQCYTTRFDETNYCLGNADDLTVLHPPALAIPDPPPEDDMAEKWEEPEPAPAPGPQLKPIETIRQIGNRSHRGRTQPNSPLDDAMANVGNRPQRRPAPPRRKVFGIHRCLPSRWSATLLNMIPKIGAMTSLTT